MKKVLVIVEGSYAKNNGVEASKQYVAIDSKKTTRRNNRRVVRRRLR